MKNASVYRQWDWTKTDADLAETHRFAVDYVRHIRANLNFNVQPHWKERTPKVKVVKPEDMPLTEIGKRLLIATLASEHGRRRQKDRDSNRVYFQKNKDKVRARIRKWRSIPENAAKIEAARKRDTEKYNQLRRERTGMRTRAQYLADVKAQREARWTPERLEARRQHELAKAREYNRRQRVKNRVPKYVPEPRGADGKMPRHTLEVIKERRQAYINWWAPIVRERKKQWIRESWAAMTTGQRDLADRVRCRLNEKLNGKITNYFSPSIGCSTAHLRKHIESQFKAGWTWGNRGEKWHIDHIVPLAEFDLSDPVQRRVANHYKNLRPMAKWANERKSDKMTKAADKLQQWLRMESQVIPIGIW
jgi:hypothetical protein